MTEATVKVSTDEALIQELITRGVATNPDGEQLIYPSRGALEERLRSGEQLTAYLGIDPTDPNLHIGHVSQLLRLRRLQNLGHRVILLIGDFTGRIGDPTDKSATRKRLTEEEVMANAAGYRRQASAILDFEHPTNPARLAYNSEWLGPITLAQFIDVASRFTHSRVIERDMFQKRIKEGKPLWFHELLYPFLQGLDSSLIVPEGVDIELGGSDQVFNMLFGAEFVRQDHGKQKFVIAGSLLADPGGKKIGKTEGNMVAMTDTPLDMFQKVMLLGDGITPVGLELCTTMSMAEIAQIKERLAAGELSPIEGKKIFAGRLVSELYSPETAALALKQYRQLIEQSEPLNPALFDFTEHIVTAGQTIVDILVASGLAKGRNEARRLLKQGGVYINEERITDDSWAPPAAGQPLTLRRGAVSFNNFRRLTLPQTAKIPRPRSAPSGNKGVRKT